MPYTRHTFVRHLRISVPQTGIIRTFNLRSTFINERTINTREINNNLINTAWKWFTVYHFNMKMLKLSALMIARSKTSNFISSFTFEQPYPSSTPAEVFPFKSSGSSHTINSSGLKNLEKVL